MNIVDMHCDTVGRLLHRKRELLGGNTEQGEDFTLRRNGFHVDLEKIKSAGYLLQNFALFVNMGEAVDPWEEVLTMADLYYEEMALNRDLIRPALSYTDIEHNRAQGLMSALLTVEEGGVCKENLVFLRTLYRLGVRMLTLTWNYPNEIAAPNLEQPGEGTDPASFRPDFRKAETRRGLTETGFAFLEEMERLGMIIDVSHLSDAGFYDVLSATHKPFVASHSNARSVCSWVRNMTDDMIRGLAGRGGVMGLNFCPAFLEDTVEGENTHGTIESIVRHAKHIVKVGGIGVLGIGTDYDGIVTHEELPDASKMPLLIDAFGKAGFTAGQIDQILYGNVLRVYKELLG